MPKRSYHRVYCIVSLYRNQTLTFRITPRHVRREDALFEVQDQHAVGVDLGSRELDRLLDLDVVFR